MSVAGVAPIELGTKKISKLLKMYAVPGIIAQTAASLYNMVDSIYIGHIPGVGSSAISGLAVSFPLMNLSAAMGTLVGVGAMTLISVLLGQKNYDVAKKVLTNVLTLNIVIGVLFSAVTLLFLNPILCFFGASPNTLPYASDYMSIILVGNVFTHLYFGFNGIIRSSGSPKVAMYLTLFTVISNAILDPVFIFVFKMGIKGAALATILCQIMALSYSLRFLSDKKRILHFARPFFHIDWRIAKQSLSIGLGPFLLNSSACLVSIFINQVLSKYGGDLAIGSYGIINRFNLLFFMICMGFNQGLQPIAGYNFGAKQYSRVKEIFMLTVKWEVLVTTICFLISEFASATAIGMFTNDQALVDMGSKAMRLMNGGIALVGFGITSSNFFQCLGMVKKSIFLSLCRQLIFLIPLVYMLPRWLQADGVWMSAMIADFLSVIVSAIFIVNIFKKFSKLKDGQEPSILGSSIQ